MFRSLRHRRLIRTALFAAWLIATLNAAAPWLAHVAAQAQGKSLVQICTAHGVRIVAIDDKGESSEVQDAAATACPLTALSLLATPPQAATVASPPAVVASESRRLPAIVVVGVVDSVARWQARRKQGPPAA